MVLKRTFRFVDVLRQLRQSNINFVILLLIHLGSLLGSKLEVPKLEARISFTSLGSARLELETLRLVKLEARKIWARSAPSTYPRDVYISAW